MPYKIIEGVYTKENYNHNNFPVYRQENGNLLFYFHISKKGQKYLSFGLNLKDYFGVAAAVFNAVDPVSWLSSGSLNRSDVFGGLVYKWMFYHTRHKTSYYVTVSSSSPMIKAVCVEEDFRECNSDRLYLNDNFTDRKGNVVNDLTRDYFFRKQDVFQHLRPVYQHSRQQWYLEYINGLWMITEYFPRQSARFKILMKTKDFALRPEYISKTWSVHFNRWHDIPNVRLLCRGVRSMSNTCPSKPCNSKASCMYTSGNETLCLCPSGYTGVTCSTNKQCPTPYPSAGTELNFAYFGKRPGDIGVSFCGGLYPSVRFSLCRDSNYSNPYWFRLECQRVYTGRTSPPWSSWNPGKTQGP